MENMYKHWVLEEWENSMKDEKEVWLESALLDKTGFILKFDSDGAQYTFRFPCLSPVRIIDEAYRLGLWTIMKNQGVLGKSPTWMVNNSDFIDNLNSNGEWSHFNPKGKHYLFITSDLVIDVLSAQAPEISKQSTLNSHFVLSNDDFDRLAHDLQDGRIPSEAIQRTRSRFAQLRSEKLK